MPISLLTIYLSSPGDVLDERAVVLQVIDRLQYDPFLNVAAHLHVVSWDNPASPLPMPASEPPQAAINEMQHRPSECDIFIAVLWSRLGTPPRGSGIRSSHASHRSGTAWEIDDALDGSHRRPDVLIYRKTAPALIRMDLDWRQRGEQYDALQAYISVLQARLDSSGHGRLHDYDTLDEFRSTVDSHLRHVIARRLGLLIQKRPATVGWQRSRSPYPGLVAFTSEDSAVFFGRDREVDQLVEIVRRSPLTAVVGSSGSGKSSVIGAGLIPRLAASSGADRLHWITPRYDQNRSTWVGPRITPAGGGDPAELLALSLREVIAPETCRDDQDVATRDLCRQLCQVASSSNGQPRRVLIIVDQFEEVYTVVETGARQEFLDLLVTLADEDLATVVLGMRADFLGSALEHEGLARHLRNATQPLSPPALSAIRTMIEQPAKIASLEFDADLPDLLLLETRQEPGRLPLLAFTLSELYRHRDNDRLTLAAYRKIGGVPTAISHLAERTFSALAKPVRDEFDAVFRRLVDVDEVGGPVGKPARQEALSDNPLRRSLVEALIDARLLVVQREAAGEPVIELAHEALFRGWPRLRTLIDGTHDDMLAVSRMRRAAAEWSSTRDPLLLWAQERMNVVHAAISRLDVKLTDEQSQFLRPETDRLLMELEDDRTTHARRHEISMRLAILGDPRPGVGVVGDDCPHIEWCWVAPEDTSDIPFWIARYPVTVMQLHAYRHHAFVTDVEVSTGLEGIQRNLPAPCTWIEAVEFCNWLARRAATTPGAFPASAPAGYTIRLPTEREWMLSAGASRGFDYPWGPVWDERCGNSVTSDLGRPIAVGMYPRGQAGSGAFDLSGNVWEWVKSTPTTHDGDDLRAAMGGSALERPDRCAITSSRMMRGDVVRMDRGFRVCFGPKL